MEIYYTEEGNIQIELTSREDRIIWNQLFNAQTKKQVTFKKTNCGETFIAYSPKGNVIDTGNEIVELDGEVDIEILKDYARDQSKLGAVKYYKEVTGLGLKESKDVIDKVWAHLL